MNGAMVIYGDVASGNCLKVKLTADHLGIPYVWHPVDVVAGEARTAAFLRVNPGGKVPAVVLPGGDLLTESNAIIHYLARGSALMPDDPLDHARMLQWMFWEQYSHEPYIAVRRYHLHLAGTDPATLDPKLLERGNAALAVMEAHLAADGQRRGTGSSATVRHSPMWRWSPTRAGPGRAGLISARFRRCGLWAGRVECAVGIGSQLV